MSSRGAGIAGVASFVLIVAAALVAPLWGIEPTQASNAAVAHDIAEQRHAIPASIFVYSLALVLWFPFGAGVWSRLRVAEPAPHPLAATFALGLVAMTTLILAGFVPIALAAYRAPSGVAVELRDLSFGLLAISGIPTAVTLGAYAWVVRRTRCLDPWSAGIAAVGAVAHIVIAASFLFRTGFFSLEGGVIIAIPATLFGWILLASVALLRAREAPALGG
jgi:hypothetical protein